MAANYILLSSSLQPGECESVIASVIDTETTLIWAPKGNRPIVGYTNSGTFRLHKRINYRNSFQTFVYGRIKGSPSGSTIALRFRPNLFAIGFTVFASIWGVLIARESPGSGVAHLVSIFWFVAIWAIYGLGRYIARNERSFLISFLQKHLNTVD